MPASVSLAELFAPETPPSLSPPDPLELLGWMLELRGTVRMCTMLDEQPPPIIWERSPRLPSGDPLWRLAHIQSLALRPLRDPTSGRHALADATCAHEILAAVGQLGRRRRNRIEAAADEIAGEFHSMIRTRVVLARAGIDELREQLTDWLKHLGPAAAYLVDLDVALRESTESRTRQLVGRIASALHRRFREQLFEEVSRLPDDLPLESIEAWYRPGGWIHEHLGLCRHALEALCRHEARALEGLIAAAHELATDTENDTENDG